MFEQKRVLSERPSILPTTRKWTVSFHLSASEIGGWLSSPRGREKLEKTFFFPANPNAASWTKKGPFKTKIVDWTVEGAKHIL